MAAPMEDDAMVKIISDIVKVRAKAGSEGGLQIWGLQIGGCVSSSGQILCTYTKK
jgi:hypothetical protein